MAMQVEHFECCNPGAEYTPGSASSILRRMLDRAATAFDDWRDRRDRRAALSHLVTLDEHILDDIGVRREEVRWALKQPIEVNGSLALRELANKRRVEEAR